MSATTGKTNVPTTPRLALHRRVIHQVHAGGPGQGGRGGCTGRRPATTGAASDQFPARRGSRCIPGRTAAGPGTVGRSIAVNTNIAVVVGIRGGVVVAAAVGPPPALLHEEPHHEITEKLSPLWMENLPQKTKNQVKSGLCF